MKLVTVLLATSIAFPAVAQVSTPPADRQTIEQQLQDLLETRRNLAKQMSDFDSRIDALEAQLHGAPAKPTTPAPSPGPATAANAAPAAPATEATQVTANGASATQTPNFLKPKTWGSIEPGRGFVLARTDRGEVDMVVLAYVRYLNQSQLDSTYTDFFGHVKSIHLQTNIEINKINVTFKGWAWDPKFRYLFFIWTNNSAQGEGGQVVLGGNVGYQFADWVGLYAGIDSVPSTRSTTGSYPNWLRNDNRLMADEFFRGSFTTGIWLDGTFSRFRYRLMAANNLSQLGVSSSQMYGGIHAFSGYLRWMPTTGEFGPVTGFGDYEDHQQVATDFEGHFTWSRENAQEQPGTDQIENSQIRLSDGERLFDHGVFGTPYSIERATYQMAAGTAAVKYKGYALEGEFYARWVNDFQANGPLPYSHMFDTGIGLQASGMAIQKRLQAYATYSHIWGQFGDSDEVVGGLNWYPLGIKNFRLSPNAMYFYRSPVGYNGVPYAVGGTGWVFYIDAALAGF
jgi:hypothetical protein